MLGKKIIKKSFALSTLPNSKTSHWANPKEISIKKNIKKMQKPFFWKKLGNASDILEELVSKHFIVFLVWESNFLGFFQLDETFLSGNFQINKRALSNLMKICLITVGSEIKKRRIKNL
jgi:hypothetical protein